MIFWDRSTLKDRAKLLLKNTYWMTFLASLIVSILAGSSGSSASSGMASGLASGFSSLIGTLSSSGSFGDIFGGIMLIGATFFIVMLIAVAFGLAVSVFFSNIIRIGFNRFLMSARYGRTDIGLVFSSFKQGQYMNAVKVMFKKELNVFLWSLLFLIPGIIKSYEYWMVSYIVAENPYISKERALEISSRTTDGEKWNIFVLNLSFIGWNLLGMLACGIGTLFVTPYYEATMAELYGALRYKAVVSGFCTRDEIGAELFVQA